MTLQPLKLNTCPSFQELRENVRNADAPFWSHVSRCARCLRAAALFDPDLGSGEIDPAIRRACVIDPALYTELIPLASGGMYQTWRATDRRLGREVVIKSLPPRDLRQDPARRRLLSVCLRREVRTLAKLQHPSIVKLLEAGEWRDGEFFYAMEYVHGKTLREVVRFGNLADRLRLLPAFTGIVDAVAYSHSKGVLHRDLTPNNIIIGESEGAATLIDWTTAKEIGRSMAGLRDSVLDAAELPTSGPTLSTWGTPGFAPPEQIRAEAQDLRTDVFTLGASLHFLVTGQAPFAGEDTDSLTAAVLDDRRVALKECPSQLRSIINRSLSKDPARRFQSIDEFARELRSFQVRRIARQVTVLDNLIGNPDVRRAFVVVTLLGLVGTGFWYRTAKQNEEDASHQSEIADRAFDQAEQTESTAEELQDQAMTMTEAAFDEARESATMSKHDREQMLAAQKAMQEAQAAAHDAQVARLAALSGQKSARDQAQAALAAERESQRRQIEAESRTHAAESDRGLMKNQLDQALAEKAIEETAEKKAAAHANELEAALAAKALEIKQLQAAKDQEVADLKAQLEDAAATPAMPAPSLTPTAAPAPTSAPTAAVAATAIPRTEKSKVSP